MKNKSLIVNILILILFSLQIACQDRLIVLWDEAKEIAPLLVMDSMHIQAGVDQVTSQSTYTASGSQTENSVVDIVMVIDNSKSMADEVDAVRTFINRLSSQMDSSKIDYHFILISAKTSDPVKETYPVNVPAPLGTSSRFMHIDETVLSRGPLRKPGSCFSQYSSFLRNNAVFHIVMITDADSPYLYSTFKTDMASKGKPDFELHGIVGINESPTVHIGTEYIAGINDTKGVLLDISTPTENWGNLFNKLTEHFIQNIPPNLVYVLNHAPIILDGSAPEQSLTVSLNGNIIAHPNNWQYNSTTNSVEFLSQNLIQEGTNINVSYILTQEIPPGMVYFLENEPVISDESNPEKSFTLKIDGVEIQAPGNWKYRPSNNSILFLNPDLLKDGGTIEVEYQTMP